MKRVPFVPQLEFTECGAASLAMVLGWHGHHAPLAEVRQACGVSRDGASALALVRAARGFGLEARGVKVELEQLDHLPLPAILHWDFSHFLVLERITPERAILVDPACGRRRLTRQELGPHFTGAALLFEPGPGFRRRPRKRPSLAKYRQVFRSHLPSLVQLLLGALALQALGLAFPMASQLLLDRVLTPRQPGWLWGLAGGLLVAALIRTALEGLQGWIALNLRTALDDRLMDGFLEHLLRLPLAFFQQRQAGDLAQRVQGTATVRNLLGSRLTGTLLNVFLLLGFGGLMMAYHPKLALWVMGFALGRTLLGLHFRERQREAFASELAASGAESAALLEALTGLETTKASGAEGRMLMRWSHRMTARVNAGLSSQRVALAASAAAGVFQAAGTGAILLFGGGEVLQGSLTLGMFVGFLTLEGLLAKPLEGLLEAVAQMQHLGCHLSRLDDVLETPAEPSGTRDPGPLQGRIVLRGVSFRHVPGGPEVLSGIDLTIRPGEKVAIAGPSGAGKSTLARLLLGLERPSHGSIAFDGMDLLDLDLRALRRRMGVVLQEPFLFDDTVRANLTLNDPECPLERLRWAAGMACVEGVIEALPEGYETRLGENGARLSGGERQRLCLARALCQKPSILLLDEATSSLDLGTEERIHENLAGLRCTRILIAHRPATLRDADRILVLAKGRLVQEGPYGTLAGRPGLFRQLLDEEEPIHA